MREVGLGVVAALVLIVVGSHAWGGPTPMLWVHAVGRQCTEGIPVEHCVDTVSARVTEVSHDTELTLSAPARGELHATLSPEDAGRLALEVDDEVRATVLGTEVLRVTAHGRTTNPLVRLDKSEALLRFLAVSAGSILVVAAFGLLWRGRRALWWVRPVAACVATGTLLGVGVSSLAPLDFAMPVLFALTVAGSLLTAYLWVARLHPALDRARARRQQSGPTGPRPGPTPG
jgi:hypothetical protein